MIQIPGIKSLYLTETFFHFFQGDLNATPAVGRPPGQDFY